ncbi:MAG: OmpA family protein [Saprospiraceae bacterium]|nr:OmpA family protein [Saprospiraceae bacterium]
MKPTMAFLSILSLAYLATGCVTQQKYSELEESVSYYKKEAQAVDSLNNTNQELDRVNKELEDLIKEKTYEVEQLTATNINLNKSYREILDKYNGLVAKGDEVLAVSAYEKTSLQNQLSAQQSDLDRQRKTAASMEYELSERDARISQLEYNFDGTPKGYDTPQNDQAKVTGFLYNKRMMIAELKQKLQSAFLGYNSDNISVIDKNGGVAVVFSEALLFPSGNEQVDINGRRSLVQLTDVINARVAELDIRIEGHVNSEAIAERNWDVSTLRAVSVAKVLTAYGIPPERITATGRADYAPVASNTTPQGRAANRRTEIIITPNNEDLNLFLLGGK